MIQGMWKGLGEKENKGPTLSFPGGFSWMTMFYNQKPERELKCIDLVSTCDVIVDHFKALW